MDDETELEAAARRRLERIQEIRRAGDLAKSGLSSAEVASEMQMPEPRARRLIKMEGDRWYEHTPEELIMWATVERSDRRELIEALCNLTYTYSVHAPWPAEGASPGTWDEVRAARASGLLSDAEFAEIVAAVKPKGP